MLTISNHLPSQASQLRQAVPKDALGPIRNVRNAEAGIRCNADLLRVEANAVKFLAKEKFNSI
jgi:hypothetical protein